MNTPLLATSTVLLAICPLWAAISISPPEYQVVLSEFSALHATSSFPVAGKNFNDIESTFGVRFQNSTQKIDFHRGIDVDGVEGDHILAVSGGVYWETRNFDAGGLTVILRHDFSTPVTLNGNSYNHYFTYYMHLFDDGIDDNGIGTLDLINGWTSERHYSGSGTPISSGQHIGFMGSSGSSGGAAYNDHLHLELRVGTTNSLQFQIGNPSTTQHGFDPHLHPMLFWEPYLFEGSDNSPTLVLDSPHSPGESVTLIYSNNDEMPILNRMEVKVIEIESGIAVQEHILDLNLRTGFDASSTITLDPPDVTKPYFDPVPFGNSATEYTTHLIVPNSWLEDYDSNYRLDTVAYDIWGNPISLQVSLIPEPRTYAIWAGLSVVAFLYIRRRSSGLRR